MVFSSVPVYLDPPNWQQQPGGGGTENDPHQLLPPPLPPPVAVGGGGTGSIRQAGSMARVAKLSQPPEAALKCPRCESTNTKFCYFNNYSLSQPRHFCKTCRRYWTRGGELRNVPVGGGFRRNKRSSKGNRSKSPVTSTERQAAGSSDTIGHLPPPLPPPQFPFFPSLHHLSDYGPGDIGFNFGVIQPPVAATGGGGPILSGGFAEQWRLQQVQQYPFLAAGLEPPAGIYQYDEGQGVEPILDTVKVEENQGLNLSRNFLGIPGNDQYWSGNIGWTDLSGFTTSSSTSHLF